MKRVAVWELVKSTASEWVADNCMRLGASLAFYTMLSIAPLLVIVTAIAGFVFGPDAARGGLVHELTELVGPEAAQALQTMLAHAYQPTAGVIATVIGVTILVLGAVGVFVELQDALNFIWGAQSQAPSGLWGFIRTRLLSFLMILVIGFLLLASLVVSTALTALGNYLGGHDPTLLFQVINQAVSLGVTALLFALIFKFLPDVHVAWRDVWIGALLTAGLFTLGKYLIGLYLGSTGVASTYGAVGSLAVLLIWVYYSGQILYFGAEFTQVYANCHGSHCRTKEAETLQARKECLRQAAGRPRGTTAGARG
jgi:membrane protein